MKLCLVHTADLHNHLTRARAEQLRDLKATRQALLLDCGDAIAAPNIVAFPWPEPAIGLMNVAGYDAMCLGNREYAWYRRGLLGKTRQARFPVLAANLQAPPGTDLGPLRRWAVVTAPGGVRVGLLGLTQVMIRPGSALARVAAGRFTDQVSAAREAVAALRPDADVLVALTHYGHGQEAELAAACPELDAILCGHWHVDRPSLEMVGRTALARTFHHGRGASILTLADGAWRQEELAL
jgi:2',3'-cyclic-nucleotide 2'-phosphodiesterase (5'-nucleotidase family)